MTKLSIAIFPILLITGLNTGCNQSNDKRMEVIKKVVLFLSKNDTTELYNIVDTSKCFRIYGKQGFINKINYAYEKFKICSDDVKENMIKKIALPFNIDEYTLSFCRSSIDSIVNGSFDLKIQFANYEDNERVKFMDIVIYMPSMDNTLPAPKNH